MSNFILKIIATITMFIDHLGYAIYGKLSYFNYIGRLAFPIFAFGISEGYIHTKSKKNYLIRLFIFAISSQVPFMLFRSMFTSGFALNIFFTLFIGLIAIIGYEQCENKYIGILLVVCLAITADTLKTDYGYFGVLMIFIFHIFKNKKLLMNISYIALCIFRYMVLCVIYNFSVTYIILCVCTILPIIFINLYNEKKGIELKYFLYGFYPAHLMLLYVFNILFI